MTRLRSSLSASFLLHIMFAGACLILMQRQPKGVDSAKRMTWIEIEPASQPREQARKKEDENPRKQIVQTTPGKVVDKAEKDAFLGEKTQVVDRQTVSKDRKTVLGDAGQPKPQSKTSSENAKSASKSKSASAKDVARSEGKAKELPQTGELSKFGLPIISEERLKANANPGAAEAERNWAYQGRQLQDYVKGLKEGETTALNTREFVFYGYFHRIRERLDRAWVPILRERLIKWYRSGRTLAADREHSTKVLVVLNSNGEITRVEILGASGQQMLDEAAVRAFNQAGPFPNPPKGIVDLQGEIQIPWEFVLRT